MATQFAEKKKSRAKGSGRQTLLMTTALAIVSGGGVVENALGEEPTPTVEARAELEEVVVTARRRDENLEKVPDAITAVSQVLLRENAVQSFNDLQWLVPSMTIVNSISRNEQFVSIRGISGLATDGQAVVSYLNEVPLPPGPLGGTGGGGPGLFFDLDNVQVLKGPQGTLFGRNTIGGAIVYQTKRPTENLEGYVEVSSGNYNLRELEAALHVPITDQWLMRLAVNSVKRDGFTKTLGTGYHPDGGRLDDQGTLGARATLTFKPTGSLQNDLVLSYTSEDDNGSSAILSYVDPALLPQLLPFLAEQQALGPRTQIAVDGPQYSRARFKSITDLFRYDVSDALTLRNIASESLYTSVSGIDYDGTSTPTFQRLGSDRPFQVKTLTEEPQLRGKAVDGDLSWTVGGYYESRPRQRPQLDQTVIFDTLHLNERVGYLSTVSESRAFYVHSIYDLSHWLAGLKFSGGLRYSWDQAYESRRPLNPQGQCVAPLPGASADCTLSGLTKFGGLNWNVGLDYQVRPNTLLYVAAARGYHSGGNNINAVDNSLRSYKPEYGTNLEVGVKSDWELSGMQARTNFALYHFDYTDVQTLELALQSDGTVAAVFGNAAAARTWGAEFEGTIIPTPNLELGVLFDWLDFKYTEFGPGVDRAELERETLQNRPKYKYGANVRYFLPVGENVGKVSVSARWSWQSETVLTAFITGPSPLLNQKSYGLLTLGANWDGIGGKPLDAQFYMTNATNKTYAVGGFLYSAAYGFDTLQYGEPRMFGVRLRYRFGPKE